VLGTNPADRYTIGAEDPALYRNILTVKLASATSPGVPTNTSVTSSDEGSGVVGAQVTYTATVAPAPPGTGTPTGDVSFSDDSGQIAECGELSLSGGSPDTATCTTTHAEAGSDEVTATYSGDANYTGSSGNASESVVEAAAITSANSATFTEGADGHFAVTATGTPTPALSESGTLPEGVKFDAETGVLSGTPTQEGTYDVTFSANNGVGKEATQSFTLTIDAPPSITSANNATFNDGQMSMFIVTASGTPEPTIEEWGNLPEGVSFSDGTFAGTPRQAGTFEITLTASNGIGADSSQRFTLTVAGLHVTTTSLPEAQLGAAYAAQLQAIGGETPYKWKLIAGSLPKGLRLSASGHIAGTVKAKSDPHGGAFAFMVSVTEHGKGGRKAAASLTLHVS